MSHSHRAAHGTPAKQQTSRTNCWQDPASLIVAGSNGALPASSSAGQKPSGPVGKLHVCSQLLADIMSSSSGEEDQELFDELKDQSTLTAKSATEASTYSLPSYKQMSSANKATNLRPAQTTRHKSQPPPKQQQQQQQQYHEFGQTLHPGSYAPLETVANHRSQNQQLSQTLTRPHSSAALATVANHHQSIKSAQATLNFDSTAFSTTVANRHQQQCRQFAQTLHPESTLATVANQQEHQFAQTLRPEPTLPLATVASQQQQPSEPLAASLPIMPTGCERPVRDTDRDHQKQQQQQQQHHHRQSVCRHGKPVKARYRSQQQQPSPPVIKEDVGQTPAVQCGVGGCQSSQELLARLASTEAALQRSRAEAEARLAELCSRENELMRLRHDALRREARLRAEADREKEARAGAEARVEALEKETRRLASALGERDSQLRACQEKMRRINRSLGYIARASSESFREFGNYKSAAAAATVAAAEVAGVRGDVAEDSDLVDTTDSEHADDDTDCDVSIDACSCAAGSVAAAAKFIATIKPVETVLATASSMAKMAWTPLQAGLQHRQQSDSQTVQPSPPTLDVEKQPSVKKSAANVVANDNDNVGGEDNDDREFRLGLARIDDQIRRLQASLKSPNSAA